MEALMTFFSSFEQKKEHGGRDGGGFGRNRVILEEKHFRRMGTFSGDSGKFRSWFFDLMVCIGQVDQQLSSALEGMVKKWNEGHRGNHRRTGTRSFSEGSSRNRMASTKGSCTGR